MTSVSAIPPGLLSRVFCLMSQAASEEQPFKKSFVVSPDLTSCPGKILPLPLFSSVHRSRKRCQFNPKNSSLQSTELIRSCLSLSLSRSASAAFRIGRSCAMSAGAEAEWKEFKVPRTEVDIATVLLCGQSFRWKKRDPEEDQLIGVFADRVWILRQTDSSILYKVYGGANGESKNLNSASNEDLLHKYFQLDVSLPSLYEVWRKADEKFASLTGSEYQGIRILEQDPIENIFSFICSSNNNIQRISQMVEKLCVNYGEKIATIDGKDFFKFPPVEKLVGTEVEKKLREESFGYRAGYIAKTAQKIVENGGVSWVEGLKKLSYDDARAQLQTLPGIGRKVADCICLMSLGFPQSIPVDTHIHQVAKKYLPHLAKVKTLTDKAYSEITDFFRGMYGDYAGWAHSVLFASTLRHLKTENTEKPNGCVPVPKAVKTALKRKAIPDEPTKNDSRPRTRQNKK